MPVVSYRQKLKLSLMAAVAVALCGMVATLLEVKAQEPPSIVGSSPLPGLSGATGWINSPPLTAKQLKGKVVLVDFWAYSCINCLRSLPYIEAWAQKYKDSGLVVIGVHTPEFDFEKELPKVQKAVQKFGVTYPIALDSNHAIWDAFHNEYWPAHYFIDAKGESAIRALWRGELRPVRALAPATLARAEREANAGWLCDRSRARSGSRRPTRATWDHQRRTLVTREPRTLHRPAASNRTRRRATQHLPNPGSMNGASPANGSITNRSQFSNRPVGRSYFTFMPATCILYWVQRPTGNRFATG